MVEVIEWSARLLRAADVSLFIETTSRSGPPNLFGRGQVVTANAGQWRLDLSLGTEFDPTFMKEFEARVARMRGRVNAADIPICDPHRYGPSVSPAQQPWSDETWFADSTGWVDPSGGTHPIKVAVGCNEGASELTVDIAGPPVVPMLRLGDHFSHDGWLYKVVGRNSSTGWTRFEPSARRAIPAGATLATDPPRLRCRLADDNQGRRMRQLLRWGAPITLSFVEDFER